MKRLVFSIIILFTIQLSMALAAEPIKVGFIYLLSGRAAAHGVVAKQGAEIALEEVNKAGGINGRRVVGIFEDTKVTPEIAINALQKLVTIDKVDVVIGVISSKVAISVAPVVKRLRVPLIITTAQTPAVTGKLCNRYVFRITWNNSQALMAAAMLASNWNAKTWTTIGPDYALGHSAWDLFQKYMRQRRQDIRYLPRSEVVLIDFL